MHFNRLEGKRENLDSGVELSALSDGMLEIAR